MTAQPSSEEALRDFAEWLRSSLALAEGFSLGSLLTGGTLDSLQRAELAALLEERFSSSAGDLLLQSSLTVRQLYDQLRALPPENLPALGSRPRQIVGGPRLEDEQIALLPLTADLLPWVYKLATAPATGFRWRFRGAVPSYDHFVAGLWQGTLAQFVVAARDSGQPAGLVVSYQADMTQGTVYMGAVFAQELHGSGIGIAATAIFMRYLFDVWPLRKIYLEVPDFNYYRFASGEGRLFVREGRLKEHHYYAGRYWDQHILAVRREHLDMKSFQD